MTLQEPHDLAPRLGLNVPREVWPTAGSLAEHAGAGFRWVQLHAPPKEMLADRVAARGHARAMRGLLEPTGLRLVLHAPDDLSAGTAESDRQVAGLVEYAADAGAELVAYHGLNFPDAGGPEAGRVRERAQAEERSLAHVLHRAQGLGVTLAIENLAPVFPGPPRLCHHPIAVRDLVRRLGSPAAGMLLDLGHLHITTDAANDDPAAIAAACAADVVLFHVHDNLGWRRREISAPGIDPLRIDLHLAPGAGTLPWSRLAEIAAPRDAPLVLEIQPQHRPALARLHGTTAALLTPGAAHARAA